MSVFEGVYPKRHWCQGVQYSIDQYYGGDPTQVELREQVPNSKTQKKAQSCGLTCLVEIYPFARYLSLAFGYKYQY